MTSTGYSYAAFWPLTEYRLPAGGLYLSTDRWPALVAGLCAVLVWRSSDGSACGDMRIGIARVRYRLGKYSLRE